MVFRNSCKDCDYYHKENNTCQSKKCGSNSDGYVSILDKMFCKLYHKPYRKDNATIVEIKPMIYKNLFDIFYNYNEILNEGIYRGYHYVIASLGTHPCAYIEIPEGHRYYNEAYDEIPLDCHFGLTYTNDTGILNGDNWRSGYWIGWDYAHLGDYYCAKGYSKSPLLKRWTTEEILAEVKNVINQLVEGDNND